MKRKNIIILVSIIVWAMILGRVFMKEDAVVSEDAKKDFLISVVPLGSSEWQTTITKNATVEWSSDIILSALTAGRVQSIRSDIGKDVSKGSLLVQLMDNQWSTTFRAQNARLSINSAENSYEVQKKNLEKQITDLMIAQERAQLSYTNTAWGNINNTILQLSGLQKSLEKNRLDYDNKVKSDTVTITNNIATAKNVYTDTMNLLLDVIDQGDKILWVTPSNKNPIEEDIYIGWKNIEVRRRAESLLKDLFVQRENLQKIWNAITEDNISEYLEKYRVTVTAINEFTISMKDVLVNSIEDLRYLPKALLDWYSSSFGGLQSKASGINSSITAQINGLSSFLSSYKDQQESLRKQIEIAENTVLVQQTQLQEQAKNSSLNLQSTSGNLWFAQDTKELNLDTIRNNLAQAQVALREAEFNLSKLSITTPIDGIVADILVDVGQEVSMGTPIVKLVSNGQEVNVTLSDKELEGITVGDSVSLVQDQNLWTWVVVSIGKVADKNGNYPVKVFIEEWEFAVGSFIDVAISASRTNKVIPLNAITIVDNSLWQIVVWDGSEITTKLVTLGMVFGDYAEIKDTFDSTYQLVISDVKNFDPAKMVIKVK